MNKFTKWICIVLCLCLLISNTSWLFVYGQTDVVTIASLEDFLAFAENCRLDSFSAGKTFQLIVDLDLADVEFDGVPIFCGTFEGNGHTISGLNISSHGSTKGLFRYVEATATIRDLRVKGTVNPAGDRSQVGGIAGNNAGIIENCSFTGTVNGAEQAGGMVGYNGATGLIRGCVSEGNVSGKHFVGGIAGSNDGVIENSTNHAKVNTTSQQNDIGMSDISLDNLLQVESAATTTDIGGIAGASGGMILNCTNFADVGYKHMGYNVGGIVGLQSGYVANCKNLGAVSGRKEVGGIVGQQEPEVVLQYDTDTLQILKAQLADLGKLVNEAAGNTQVHSTKIQNLLNKIDRYTKKAEKAADDLEEAVKQPKFEDLQLYAEALKTIHDSLTGISDTMHDLQDAIKDMTSDMEADLQAISDKMDQIQLTLDDSDANLGGQILDISDADTEDNRNSKVQDCRNEGSIFGDSNVGGILGAVSFENDLDPEEDITILGDVSLNAVGSLRSVVRGCANVGTVAAKYQRVGGIVGWLTMGLVRDCTNTGMVGADTVEFAGGIAGDAYGYIRNCKVKCAIYGERNVGGIAGCGAVASDCFAMVELSGTEGLGGIFGKSNEPASQVEDPVVHNFYYTHGADVGGIDGISYDGKAKGLTLQIFLLSQDEVAFFHQVTVSFVANGDIVQTITLKTGTELKDIPDVPQKAGHVGIWADLAQADMQRVVFDHTFVAEYTPFISVVQSVNTDDHNKPILLLQGNFSNADPLTLTGVTAVGGLYGDQKLLEAWEFTAVNCVTLQAGRLLLPQGVRSEDVVLLVQDADGNWQQRSYRVDESYLVFSLQDGENAVAIVAQGSAAIPTWQVLLAAGITVAAVVCAFAIILKNRKKKAKLVVEQAQ